MALPSLHSELVCLETLQEILQKRLDLERAYSSSLAAWRTDTHKTTSHIITAGLRDVFLSLVEAAENSNVYSAKKAAFRLRTGIDIQSRQDMETRFKLQIKGVLAATEKLRGYFKRIGARLRKLEEFDDLARKALWKREFRYKEWKDWKPKPVSPAAISGWLRSKSKNPPALTEGTMADAYNLADMEVRRLVSTAEIARCSFKDKAIAEVDVISVAYQVATNAITKCLRLFAEDQQECASNASAGAGRIVKVACDTFGFRLAGIFQEVLASEAQDISTASMPYNDLESISLYPTIKSQPIILGFSLPPYYFSCTASTRFVVGVFCQLVSFVNDNQAWDKYLTPVDNSLAATFRELERSWSGDQALNRNLLRSFGTSICADLVKILLASFPEPLIDCSEVPPGNLRLWNEDTARRPNTACAGLSDQDSGVALVPLVPPLYNRPQGEILQALCISLIPVFRGESALSQDLFYGTFSNLLTRKGACIEHAIRMLVRGFSTTVTAIDEKDALHRLLDPTRNTTLPTPFQPSDKAMNVTQILPTSAPPGWLMYTPPPAVLYAPQSITPAKPTTVNVDPRPGEALSNRFTSNVIRPSHLAPNSGYRLTINDARFLKYGIVKTPKNKSYTILLVGGTGVGKSSLLKYIANVLLGNDIDHFDLDILNRPPSKGGAVGQTASPHLYEITSVSGLLVRILDTPGLGGIHDIERDEIYRESIVRYIEQHVEFVSAVLILALEESPVRMEYTFSTLSAIFPKTLVNNIAFVPSNLWSHSPWNLSQEMVPGALRNSPVFPLGSPIALQLQKGLYDVETRANILEQGALEALVKLFNWLDDLEPQPATEIVSLYEKYQNIEAKTTNILDQIAREVEIDRLMIRLKKHSADMNTFSGFVIPKQQSITTRKIDNQVLVDGDMKRKWDDARDGKETTAALIAVNEMRLHQLKQVNNCAAGDLAQLVGQYARLSLAGNCSAQLRSAVRCLEAAKRKAIYDNGLTTFGESLDHMKSKLEFLNKVEEDAQKVVSG